MNKQKRYLRKSLKYPMIVGAILALIVLVAVFYPNPADDPAATWNPKGMVGDTTTDQAADTPAGTTTPPDATATDPELSMAPMYIIRSSGGTYSAENVATGAIVHSGTDAAEVIHKAINGLSFGRTWKEKVLLQGDFVLTKAITIPSYTVLQLDGKVTMGVNANDHMVTATGMDDFDVIGGEWDGNQASQSLGGTERRGLDFTSCTDFTIQDLKVHDTAYGNICCLGCDNATIRNVESYNSGDKDRGEAWIGPGITMPWSNNCLLEGCYIHDTTSGGCYFYCEDDGITQTVSNNVLRNNTVERTTTSGLSISLRGVEDIGDNNLIENNTIIDCGLDGEHPGINVGWYTSGVELGASYCTVRGNEVYETGDHYSAGGGGGGISIEARYCLVTNNNVHDTTDCAILIRGESNTVSDNVISNVRTSTYPGIQIYDGDNNEIVRNTIRDCSTGVKVVIGGTTGCDNNRIADNRFENMADRCVSISDGGSAGNIVENNVFVGTSAVQDEGTGTIIRNNVVLS